MDASRLLQRVIMPRDADPLDVRPLYLDEPEQVHCHVSNRQAVTVPPSALVSFASYFNAFPAGYWRRWTVVEAVTLRMKVRGARVGGRLDLIEQDDLGGAGGFTRGLYEATEHSDVDQTMLMDDDIMVEPNSVLRASAFAAAAASPTIVGCHMLNLHAKSRLHS